MTLIMILAAVFVAVGLMVVLGERFASPMSQEQASKYGKIIPILVFVMIFAAIIRLAMM